MKQSLRILQLYPREMNIYGDFGNVLTLQRRCQWRGISVEIISHQPNKTFPHDIDIVVGGGGQDSGQDKVAGDLQRIAAQLRDMASNDTPMLLVCGLYQLFGRFFQTADGRKIEGICLFKLETTAGPKRLIGNVVSKSQCGDIVGYENHSGLTYLDPDQRALGHVKKGFGNNDTDKTEGAVYKNVIGTYLHGSLLPKNPRLADHLISKALMKKYGQTDLAPLDDRLAEQARRVAATRPR